MGRALLVALLTYVGGLLTSTGIFSGRADLSWGIFWTGMGCIAAAGLVLCWRRVR
jgi:hypothetical protein